MKTRKLIPLALVIGLFAVSSIWWAPRIGAAKIALTSAKAGDKLGRRYADIYKEEDRSKLIKFSHVFHKDAGASCTDCHASAENSSMSTDNNLPKMENCYQCHDKSSKDCAQCHAEPREPYSAFAAPKRELKFNHQQHMKDQKLECATCHADIEKKDYVNVRSLPKMETCMTCHNGAKAPDDCRTCHTDIRFIRPASHEAGFLRTHKQLVAASSDANCLMCHSQSSCQECHQGGEAIGHMKKANEFESSRGGSVLSTGSGQVLQNIHSLDYIVTHRFDFKSKTNDCQSCHEAETFCVTCHMGGGKAAKPAWHNVAGFVSAGGGFHGKLAEKDMEACMVCHAAPTEDITCMQCHNAKGGQR